MGSCVKSYTSKLLEAIVGHTASIVAKPYTHEIWVSIVRFILLPHSFWRPKAFRVGTTLFRGQRKWKPFVKTAI